MREGGGREEGGKVVKEGDGLGKRLKARRSEGGRGEGREGREREMEIVYFRPRHCTHADLQALSLIHVLFIPPTGAHTLQGR